MTEIRNRKKRSREHVESNHDSTNTTTHPPTKKRRIQSKQSKKSRNKDMNKWTIDELKKYLNKNAITFQMNKDKLYYYRLASMHKTVQENKAKEKREKKQRQNSPIVNGGPHPPQSPINNKTEKESPSAPLFSVPQRPTPPLPSSLSHRPLTSDTFSDEHNNSEKEEEKVPSSLLSQRLSTNTSQNKPKTTINSPIPQSPPLSTPTDSDKTTQIVTPHSLKSRSHIQTVTPSNPTFRSANQTGTQQYLRNNPEFDVSYSNNINNAPVYPRNPSPPQETLARDRRLGPFQDIPTIFSFDGYSMPTIPKMTVPFEIPGFSKKYKKYIYSDNKYLVLLCGAVILILMAMCIPYFISLFVQTPYCDTNYEAILGSYAVLNGIIPLESIMKCQTCPYNAQCFNGTAVCALNYKLDAYHTICLDNNDNDAVFASQIANKAYYILGRKLGDWECNDRNDSFTYELDEISLKTEIKGYFADKDDSPIVESLSENENEVDESDETEQVEDDHITNKSHFDDGWEYAMTKIIPYAYKDKLIVHDQEEGRYKSLRPIPSSIYCKAAYLKREYMDEIGIELGFIWGFTVMVVAMLFIFVALRSKVKKVDEKAIVAANFVLQKLSQQRALHFSIVQFKHFTMRRQGISSVTWERAVKYIDDSGFVAKIPEDIDGDVRMCWIWKAPVPFVALEN